MIIYSLKGWLCMAKKFSQNDSIQFKQETLAKFDEYLTELIKQVQQAKSEKISYWILNWIEYLKREENFTPKRMLKYKRGSIVKVHLGFNVGSEEGGLHYAIVLDSHNDLSNPLMTVVPLTSVKQHVDINNLPKNQLFIGDDIFKKLSVKHEGLLKKISTIHWEQLSDEEYEQYQAELDYAKRVREEISKMKTGSIALIGQITTISKLRIYDPRNKYGVLKDVRVSDTILDEIDQYIIKNYFKKFNKND